LAAFLPAKILNFRGLFPPEFSILVEHGLFPQKFSIFVAQKILHPAACRRWLKNDKAGRLSFFSLLNQLNIICRALRPAQQKSHFLLRGVFLASQNFNFGGLLPRENF
jgi:hypothetical protein